MFALIYQIPGISPALLCGDNVKVLLGFHPPSPRSGRGGVTWLQLTGDNVYFKCCAQTELVYHVRGAFGKFLA